MIKLTITSDGQNTNVNIQTSDGQPTPLRQVLDMITAAEDAILSIGIPTQPLDNNASNPPPDSASPPTERESRPRKSAKKGEPA